MNSLRQMYHCGAISGMDGWDWVGANFVAIKFDDLSSVVVMLTHSSNW